MPPSRNEEEAIRSYLLGELDIHDTQTLEERLIKEDEFAERVMLLEDELIEDYARGALTPDECERFKSHFLCSPRRKRKLMFVSGIKKYADAGARPTRDRAHDSAATFSFSLRSLFTPAWRAVALAVLMVAAGFVVWRVFLHTSRVDEGMLALNNAYSRRRPLETRITGFSYAPFVVSRGGAPTEVDYRSRDLAARLLLDAASKEHTAPALHAVGRVYLMEGEFDKAVAQFEEALRASPGDAQLHSDMGAVLLEVGQREEQADGGKAFETYAKSLQHINKALQLSPDLPEALFNKALVMERQILPEQAKEAWRIYLSRDPQSKWADEARHHLALLSERSATLPTQPQLIEEFVVAARARDDDRAWRLMSRNKEMIASRFLPQQLAINFLRTSSAESKEALESLAYAGALERERARDPYVSDMAAYYARSSPAHRALLLQAQDSVISGYGLCVASEFGKALEQFVKAKEMFDRAGDEWDSKLCDYWIGYCLNQEDKIVESTTLLKSLAEFCRGKGYKWLMGQAVGWIGVNYAELGDASRSIEYFNRALPVVEGIEDAYNTQKILSEMSSQYNQLSRPQNALAYNARSLQLAESAYPGARQVWRNYVYTARTLVDLKLYDAAAAFAREMLHVALTDIKTADVIHYSYHYLGQIYGELGQYDEAIRLTSEGVTIARSLKDESAARKQSTYSLLQIAHLQRKAGRCAQALGNYEQVLRVFDEMELGAYKYDAHKGRLLCHVALGNDSDIEAELPVVLEQFDEYRAKIIEEQNSNSFFDREQGIYDIAIDHAYARGETQRALAYSEESRARSLLATLRVNAAAAADNSQPPTVAQPLSLREIQERMPADVQVIQYAVLDDKTLVWLVTRESISGAKIAITSDELRTKISRYAEGVSRPPSDSREDLKRLARELYDTLVGPIAARLDPQKDVCVIPDKALSRFAFSTLVSTQSGRYLIADFSIQYAPSLSVFIHCSEAARDRAASGAESLLSVGNPSFDGEDYPGLPSLPAATGEVGAIAKYYHPVHEFVGPNAVREDIERELADADVIHFAGHYIINDRDPMSSKLVLAKGRGRVGTDDGSLAARELIGRRLTRAKLVVLSACETGAGNYYNGEGMVSISRAFLGAGIPLVVASQWSVDSAATAELMKKFHRYRKAQGLTTVAALRRAQLEMSSDPDGLYSDPYYWAAFLPTGGHVSY